MIKENSYINIPYFMVKDLELKGNELLIYAIIFGFCQDGETKFTGSLSYFAEWTSSTKQGVLKNLKSLLDKNLICRKEYNRNGIKFVEYYVTEFNGIKQSLTPPIKQSLPNNIDIYILDKEKEKEKEKGKNPPLPLEGQADFVSYEEQRKHNYDLAELTKQKMQEELTRRFGK